MYYCTITDVTRHRSTGFEVVFELRDDTDDQPVPDSDGSTTRLMGLEFPTSGTRQERIAHIRNQLEGHFQSVIDRVASGDDAYTEVRDLLMGRRYPPEA